MSIPREAVTRNELAAWAQVGLGAIGAIGTVVTTIPALRLAFAGGLVAAPGTTGGIALLQVFAALLILAVCFTLMSTGLGILLGGLFSKIGASSPYHAAFCLVAATPLAAGALTLAMAGHPLWVWCALQTLLAVLLAGQAQADPGKQSFWMLAFLGSALVVGASWALQAFVEPPPLVSTHGNIATKPEGPP